MNQNISSVGVSIDEHAYNLQILAYTYREQYRSSVNQALALCSNNYERSDCLNRLLSIYIEKLDSKIWLEHSYKTFPGFAKWHVINGGWEEDPDKVIFSDFAQSWALNWVIDWLRQQIEELRLNGYDAKVLPIMPPWGDGPTPASVIAAMEEIMQDFEQDDGTDGEPDEIWFVGWTDGKPDWTGLDKPQSSSETDSQTKSTAIIPSSPPIESTLAIHIDSTQQVKILLALTPYTSPTRVDELANLLNGEEVDTPIVINYQQNALVYIFRQAAEAGHIDADKTRIRDWLCKWFRVNVRNKERQLGRSSVYDYLTREDKKPTRNKIIPYKP